jgi:hypothetical protein
MNKLHLFQVIKMNASGLKCDNGCGYTENSLPLTFANIAKNIGRPCPRCGANLLTAEDARTLVFMKRATTTINIIAFPFMVLMLPLTLLCALLRRRNYRIWKVEMNGSGLATITEKPTTPT